MSNNQNKKYLVSFAVLGILGLAVFSASSFFNMNGILTGFANAGKAQASSACSHYASPQGGGNGSSESSPYKIVDFLNGYNPGDTLCLLDGTYTGSDSMIVPKYEYNSSAGCKKQGGGESDKPVTIRALNDGGVTLDGENTRRPVYLFCQDYWVIEGVNAHNSSNSVFEISLGNHNIIRRSVGWNASDSNANIFGVHYGDYNLLEDIAGFGIARKIISSSQGGQHTVVRRAWARWDGSHVAGPKMAVTLAYNNYFMTGENIIATWAGTDLKESYKLKCDPGSAYAKCGQTFSNYTVDQPYGIISADALSYGPYFEKYGKDSGSRLLGSIAYLTGSERFQPDNLVFTTKLDDFEIKDSVAYVGPGNLSSKGTFSLYGRTPAASHLVASGLTGIGGRDIVISADWQKSDINNFAPGSSSEAVFSERGGICNRYENGNLTNEPLWPWPMNQRIIDAMKQAGRPPVDVTQTITNMLGPIPDQCVAGTIVNNENQTGDQNSSDNLPPNTDQPPPLTDSTNQPPSSSNPSSLDSQNNTQSNKSLAPTGFSDICSPEAGIASCIQQIYILSLGIGALFTLLMLILAGYRYMTAQGNSQQVQNAKEAFASAFTGLIILFIAFILLRIINPDLVRFNKVSNLLELPDIVTSDPGDPPNPFPDPDPEEKTQCSDGIDNDSDGKTDYPNDTDCQNKKSASEFGSIKVLIEAKPNGSKDGSESNPYESGGIGVTASTNPALPYFPITWGTKGWQSSDFCGYQTNGAGNPVQFFGAEDYEASVTIGIPKQKKKIIITAIVGDSVDGNGQKWSGGSTEKEIWIAPTAEQLADCKP